MKLINWECLEEMDKLIEQWVTVDAIITDPPYWCNATMKWNYNDNEEYVKDKIPDWLDSFDNILNDNSYIFIYVPSLYLENWLIETKKRWKLLNILSVENMKVWRQYKDRFRNNCQLILVLSKWKPKWFNKVDFTLTSDSWLKDKRNPNPSKYTSTYPSYIPNYYKATVEKTVWHPDEKNSKLISKFIEIVSNKQEIILDPFMWSWTTGVAAKNTWRDFIWIELDELYYNIAKERINN